MERDGTVREVDPTTLTRIDLDPDRQPIHEPNTGRSTKGRKIEAEIRLTVLALQVAREHPRIVMSRGSDHDHLRTGPASRLSQAVQDMDMGMAPAHQDQALHPESDRTLRSTRRVRASSRSSSRTSTRG
jgi:hypothetical protein